MFHARDLTARDAVPAARPSLKPRRTAPGAWARRLRLLHLSLAALFAPAILFFAVTGALQTFSLHKANGGAAAAEWIVRAAAVHKRQTLAPKADDDQPAAPPKHVKRKHDKPAPVGPPPMPWGTLALKVYTVAVAFGLVALTLSGLYLGFKFSRRPRLILALVAVGALAPLLLLAA